MKGTRLNWKILKVYKRRVIFLLLFFIKAISAFNDNHILSHVRKMIFFFGFGMEKVYSMTPIRKSESFLCGFFHSKLFWIIHCGLCPLARVVVKWLSFRLIKILKHYLPEMRCNYLTLYEALFKDKETICWKRSFQWRDKWKNKMKQFEKTNAQTFLH